METDEYLKNQLRESFKVIDTCLSCCYAKETHMYRPLAGQLRILLCDSTKKKDNSLLSRVYPNIQLSGLASIDWSKNECSFVALHQPSDGTARIASMPYEITQYSNGLAVADLLYNNEVMLDIPSWMDQCVTHHPTSLTIRDIVRHIADKGGGAHVDSNSSAELRYMSQSTPVGRPFGELFILALARLAQAIGEKLLKYEGVKVPFELRNAQHTKYNSLLVAHHELAEALTKAYSGRAKGARR